MSEHITREQANELLHKYVKGENYITHSYAVEAIMRGLAKKLAPDEIEFWGICGLLHDLDEETADWRTDMSTHGPVSAQILKDEGYDEPVMAQAICAHNPESGVVAQIYPDKKIASVKHKSVNKRFKETRFAAGANRQYMAAIEEIGVSFDEFIDISLEAMREIADEIGL